MENRGKNHEENTWRTCIKLEEIWRVLKAHAVFFPQTGAHTFMFHKKQRQRGKRSINELLVKVWDSKSANKVITENLSGG